MTKPAYSFYTNMIDATVSQTSTFKTRCDNIRKAVNADIAKGIYTKFPLLEIQLSTIASKLWKLSMPKPATNLSVPELEILVENEYI